MSLEPPVVPECQKEGRGERERRSWGAGGVAKARRSLRERIHGSVGEDGGAGTGTETKQAQ